MKNTEIRTKISEALVSEITDTYCNKYFASKEFKDVMEETLSKYNFEINTEEIQIQICHDIENLVVKKLRDIKIESILNESK